MSLTQISAFEVADIAAMSPGQIDALLAATPILLDLDGNGVQTLAASHGVRFDLNGTGLAQRVGWASPGDGLLVLDRNHDGRVNDGTELFGVATPDADGGRAGNGYAALALLDSDHNGVLNATDARFKELQLWVDANSNGRTDEGELHALAEYGVVSLDLKGEAGLVVDHGNLLGLVSNYTSADGELHAMADVWLAKEAGQASPMPPMLNELLLAPMPQAMPAQFASGAAEPAEPALTGGGSRSPAAATFLERNGPLVDERPTPLLI